MNASPRSLVLAPARPARGPALGLKHLNDTLGHAGDSALVHLAGALTGALRTEDGIGRWGGEQFLLVLPFTDRDGTVRLAERLRSAVSEPAADPQIASWPRPPRPEVKPPHVLPITRLCQRMPSATAP